MARPRTDIRARIVHAARARFLAEGVDGASLRTIAHDARTNVGMIVYYFKTKDDLFLAVVEEIYPALLEDLSGALTADVSTRERLTRAFVRLGNLSEDELTVLRVILREAIGSSARFKLILARAKRGHLGLMIEALRTGIASGELDARIPLPMIVLATMGLGGVPQFIRRGLVGTRFLPLPGPDAMASLCADLLFRAIGAPAPAATRGSRSRRRAAPRARSRDRRSGGRGRSRRGPNRARSGARRAGPCSPRT